MKTIINKCTDDDFKYLSEILDSYVSFTNDKRRKNLLAESKHNANSKTQLVNLIDSQIKYYGSSDIAYLKRKLLQGNGGTEAREIVEDACNKLKVKIKHGGSTESLLERLVYAVVEKELISKTPEELSRSFKTMGLDEADRELILTHLKSSGKSSYCRSSLKYLVKRSRWG